MSKSRNVATSRMKFLSQDLGPPGMTFQFMACAITVLALLAGRGAPSTFAQKSVALRTLRPLDATHRYAASSVEETLVGRR